MTTAAGVLNVARGELGTAESPSGSNRVRYNTWYYGREVSGGNYPWCAVFVSWVSMKAGALGIIPKHAYTPAGAAWFKARGAWGSVPRVGAIVYYNISGLGRISHVGIVEAVNGDGTFTAIEGNTDGAGSRTGGRVMRQRRSKVGAGGGFGYPAYTGEAAPGVAARDANDIAVDGELGPQTIRRWQQVMGTPVDGVISKPKSSLIVAVQRHLNAHLDGPDLAVDGDLGKKTITALQRYLGTPADGVISKPKSSVIVALQKRLNEGRF